MKVSFLKPILLTNLLTINIFNANQFFLPKNNFTSQLYVLGDSLSDDGNLANIMTNKLWSIEKITFQAPFYHNDFSNGDVAATILAQKLGQKLIPAWNNNHTIGNNYAVAGAQASVNSSWTYKLFLNHYMLSKQTDKLLQEHHLNKNDLIFLEIGGNDVMNAMDKKTTAEQEAVINNAVTNEFASIEQLINAGANNFVISNLADLSKIPKYLHQTPVIKKLVQHLSLLFNEQWQTNFTTIKQNHPHLNIKAFDFATNFTNIFSVAQKMGKNITDAAIDWTFSGLLINKKPKYINGTTPDNINDKLFFDIVHPNKWGHEQIANKLYELIKY